MVYCYESLSMFIYQNNFWEILVWDVGYIPILFSKMILVKQIWTISKIAMQVLCSYLKVKLDRLRVHVFVCVCVYCIHICSFYVDSLQLKKTAKIIKSSLWSNTTMLTKPYCKVPHPFVLNTSMDGNCTASLGSLFNS